MDLQQNSAQPPSSTGAPVGQDSDLYAQIAGEDAEAQVVKKKNRSLVLTIVAAFMRVTLYVDSLRRTHEPVFHLLGAIWTLFMALLYCSGILMLGFSIYNRLQLPIYLEDQLRLRNVQFESADYGMDRVIVRQLRDSENMYTVDNMIIYSTFTDLLQKRIRAVILDGVHIFVDTKDEPDLLTAVPRFLSQIQNPTKGRLDIAVNALSVTDGKLTFKNRQSDVPISFTMEGIYNKKTQILIHFKVNQPSLQMDADLTLDGGSSSPEWVLSISKGENSKGGTITLPRRAPEDLTGEMKVTLNHQELDAIQASFKLGSGTIEKNITATLRKKEESALSGVVTWEKNNLTEPNLSSNLSLQADTITFSTLGSLQTKGSLIVDSKQFCWDGFGLKKLHAPLLADVDCRNWNQCEVHINKASTITIQDIWFPYQRQVVRTQEQTRFELQPRQNALFFADNDTYMTFDLPIADLTFKGSIEGVANSAIEVEGPQVQLKGALSDADLDASQVSLYANQFSYETPSLRMKEGQLSMDNLLQNTAKTKLTASDVKFSPVPLFAQPFDLVLNMVGNQASAQLKFRNQPITMQLEGLFYPVQKTFSGKVLVPPFKLQDLKVPLNTLWPSLPADLTKFSGQMTLSGQVKWAGMNNIAGPLQIGLKDVSFDAKQTHIKGVNAVLLADTVVPFTATQNQHLFVQSVSSLIPFQNVDISFQADAQSLKLNRFSALGAGIPLTLPASVISTKTANLLYLKNEKTIDPTLFQKVMSMPDIGIASGTASLSIPVEIQGNVFNIPNITMKIQNVLLQNQADKYPSIFGSSKSYFVRTGQLIMDENKVVQLALSGRLLPSKTAKDVQLNALRLPASFFKTVPTDRVPQDIQRQLNALFRN